MERIILKAIRRDGLGKGPSRRVRMDESFPAVYYRGQDVPQHITINTREFNNSQKARARVVTLDIEGEIIENCLIRDIQRHPVSSAVLHVDFQGLVPGRKVRLRLPISFVGNPAGLRQGGQIRKLLHFARISCMPEAVPSAVEVDISKMEAGQTMLVRDLPVNPGYTLMIPEHLAVIQITKPRAKA
ncbi:MAG: 50S ribosomal protein L25 [Calditrichaeota bacterium]|nr:50S ribosomal protein L25 [Candidatus Cloacimonadota bacterium]MCA9786699.1 50S ribosomal protein L25 [Candidatus Cloacimonadota bacterium]MCB1047356.1 50S ribosomal protein L25 [Calditrichota bacterium]MCB9475083.1 50S ribosomal protein L25 [Candidatus Delongbacteria bacterium]